MKRFMMSIVSILLMIILMVPVYADVDKGTLLTVEISSRYTDEMNNVQQAVRVSDRIWDKYLGNSRDDVDYSLMYQVYYLKMKDIISSYEKQGTFGANISEKYYWVVPCYGEGSEVQVVRSEQNLSGWDIRRGTRYCSTIPGNHPDVKFRIDKIYNNILTQYPNADKYSFRFVYDEGTDVHIMYFLSEGQEYLVPYFPSEDMTWIINAKIYPANEYVEIMKTNVAAESSLVDSKAPYERSEKIYLNYVLIGTVAVICVVIVAVIIAKKKKRST